MLLANVFGWSLDKATLKTSYEYNLTWWCLEHTLTFNTVNNLGAFYANQGKLVKTKQMYQQAL
jgi:hypothetical protein